MIESGCDSTISNTPRLSVLSRPIRNEVGSSLSDVKPFDDS